MEFYSIKKIVRKLGSRQKESTGSISDNKIIVQVLNGEKDLYALIARKYNKRLRSLGASMIHDDAELNIKLEEGNL
jgi:hypothetical protein